MLTPNPKSAQPTATLQKYRSVQIGLHWATVLLVVFQLLTTDAMEKFFDAAEDAGRLAGFPDEPIAMGARAGGRAHIHLHRRKAACAHRLRRARRPCEPAYLIEGDIEGDSTTVSISFSFSCRYPALSPCTSRPMPAIFTKF